MRKDRARFTPSPLLFALALTVHMGFLLSLRTGWLNPLFNDALHRFGPGCDFFSIYAAGVKSRLGEPVYPIGGHVEQVPYAYAFRYAPLVAYTLGWLLSLFPHITAYGVWLVVCELALLCNLRLTLSPRRHGDTEPDTERVREGRERGLGRTSVHEDIAEAGGRGGERAVRIRDSRYAIAFAMWLCFTPYYLELYVGQFTFITASLVFWAYLAWEGQLTAETPRTPKNAGRGGDLFWAAAVLLKMMPLLYLPIVLLRRRWGAAAGTVAVLAGTSWLYFQRFPADWKLFTATNGDPRPSWHAGNQGLMALLYALSGERVGVYLQLRTVTLVGVGLGLAWFTWKAFIAERRTGSETHPHSDTPNHPHFLYLYAACSAAYLLCYKDVWEHHYVLLLPPLVLLCLRGVSPWVWGPSYLVAALPWLFPLYDLPGLGYNEDPQRYWTSAVSLLHHAFKPVAALWLFGSVLVSAAFQHENTKVREHESEGAEREFETSQRGVFHPVPLPSGSPSCPRTFVFSCSRRKSLKWGAVVLGTSVIAGVMVRGTAWAAAAIGEQRRVSRQWVWGPELFRRQERREGCGPAALAAVCRYYDVPATEAEVAKLAGTGPAGTSMLGLLRAAQAKGLAAEGRRFTPETLATAPRPCILFFHQGHFAVLTGARGGRFYVADPSLGQRVFTAAELRYRWRGEALVLGPGPDIHRRDAEGAENGREPVRR